jgi:Prokaryotic homologs of the JAB domain
LEAAVVLARDWHPIHFHAPAGRTYGSLPDSRDLWSVLWEHRGSLLGVAHSHPGGGVPRPSFEDVTTFSAVERALGVRILWPIITTDAARAFVWYGPGACDYGEWGPLTIPMQQAWVTDLLKLSK